MIQQQRQQLASEAIDPLDKMQKAFPLIVDQQRFVQITQQQMDLANRITSLRETANASDPQVQRRMADLEVEQESLRQALDQLLDDIQTHADALPAEPEFDRLQKTSRDFVAAVRASAALSKMAGAQQQLLKSKFEAASSDATDAAVILESFLSKCNGMGDSACEACDLAFNPSAGAPNLGDSINQMLSMLGMKPGSKMGSKAGMSFGSGPGGGYSQRTPGPQNIGMYGSLPTPQTNKSQGRGDRASHGSATNSSSSQSGDGNSERTAAVKGSSSGQSTSSIPAQYRSQVAEYFRRVAEQLGEKP
jgi:hypothetical protein